MKKKVFLILIVIAIAVVAGPVLLRQVFPPKHRLLEGFSLDELKQQGVPFHEISFTNAAQGPELSGLLFTPEGVGPFPAAAIIHGSGPSHRDSYWYLTLSRYLSKSGIAVLLPDKRGSEKSKGDWRTSSFEDLATDTTAAVQYLMGIPSVDPARIGVVGLSQGGWIAPVAAVKSQDISYVVNMVGPAVKTYEQLLYEERYNIEEMGFLPFVSKALAYPSTYFIRKVPLKDFYGAVGNFDPIPYWRDVAVPALVLYGSEDTNTPTAESVKRLEALKKSNIAVKVYDGSGHGLEDPVGRGRNLIRDEALADIARFVRPDLEAAPPSDREER